MNDPPTPLRNYKLRLTGWVPLHLRGRTSVTGWGQRLPLVPLNGLIPSVSCPSLPAQIELSRPERAKQRQLCSGLLSCVSQPGWQAELRLAPLANYTKPFACPSGMTMVN